MVGAGMTDDCATAPTPGRQAPMERAAAQKRIKDFMDFFGNLNLANEWKTQATESGHPTDGCVRRPLRFLNLVYRMRGLAAGVGSGRAPILDERQKQILRSAYPTCVGPQACSAQDDTVWGGTRLVRRFRVLSPVQPVPQNARGRSALLLQERAGYEEQRLRRASVSAGLAVR